MIFFSNTSKDKKTIEMAQKLKNILIVNPGSTSTKYTLFNKNGKVLVEKKFKISQNYAKKVFLNDLKKDYKDFYKIGIRVVHGLGMTSPAKINSSVLKQIKKAEIFAPIHNKLAQEEIKKLSSTFQAPIFAVFDTDFHQTIPKEQSIYPIPLNITKKYNIKKYGFHGIAVTSAVRQLREKYKKRKKKLPKNILVAHLGGGASITAIQNGISIANSMGLTPISGLMMTTRAGDVDSDLDKILAKLMFKSVNYISELFSLKSGILGIAGYTDTKEIFKLAQIENKEKLGKYPREKLAFDLFLNSVVKNIYAYTSVLGKVDLLVFSGGIGFGNEYLRNEVMKKVKLLGLNKRKMLIIDVDENKEIYQQIKD